MARHDPDNRLSWRLAVKPLRDAFRFSGRSTRTEVWAYFLLSYLGNLFTVAAGHDPAPALRITVVAWQIGWDWPWVALLVRRLHDQDRPSAWIAVTIVQVAALIGLNMMPTSLTPTGVSVESPMGEWRSVAWSWPASILIAILLVASATQLWLFLSRGTPGTNRYGTDPRLDPQPSDAAVGY
jgi:uncharacterized membrane protein YhaH (DUF805 family)